MSYLSYLSYLTVFYDHAAWLESVGSRVLYEQDPKKPVLYVIPVESILGKLPVVPHRPCRRFWVCAQRNAHTIPRRACRPHARRRRLLSRVVCQLMGAGLVPRDVVCSFVQVNIPIQGKSARRRPPPRTLAALRICKHSRRDQLHLAAQMRGRAKPFTKPTEERAATSLRPHWKWK